MSDGTAVRKYIKCSGFAFPANSALRMLRLRFIRFITGSRIRRLKKPLVEDVTTQLLFSVKNTKFKQY